SGAHRGTCRTPFLPNAAHKCKGSFMDKTELLNRLSAAGFEPLGGEQAIESAPRIWIVPIYTTSLPLEGVVRLLDAQGILVVSNGVFLRWDAETQQQCAVYEIGVAKSERLPLPNTGE